MEFLQDMLANIASDVIFWLGLGVLVAGLYLFPAQRKFRRFFGLEHDKSIEVYISNLWDYKAYPTPWGEIIAGSELAAARRVSSLFATTSPTFPQLVAGLVDSLWFRGKYEVELKVSPWVYPGPVSNSMIVIGSTTKNSIRRYLFQTAECRLLTRIEGESEIPPPSPHHRPLERVLLINKRKGLEKHIVSDDQKPALIERTVISADNDAKRFVVIMCVGMTGVETKAAVEYLADNWRDLERASRGKDHYACCLVFDKDGKLQNSFAVSD